MHLIRHGPANLLATCLAVLMSGCGEDPVAPLTPAAPSPTPSLPAPTFPMVTMTGQVTDAAGRPIMANVAVYPLRMSPAWYGPWGRGSQTDASGRYRIANAPEHHDTV